jgi:hypothetical protein
MPCIPSLNSLHKIFSLFSKLLLLHISFTSISLANTCSNQQTLQLANKAKEEINTRLYITLATIDSHASPWNAPVYSAFDPSYHFYWMSSVKSQHSKNIRSNSKTFAVIYNSTAKEGTGFGVYLQGKSYELDYHHINAIKHAIGIMGARIHRSDLPAYSNYLAPFPRRVYVFIPHKIWINVITIIHGKKVDERLEITKCLLKV